MSELTTTKEDILNTENNTNTINNVQSENSSAVNTEDVPKKGISPLGIMMLILFIMCFVVHFAVNGICGGDEANQTSSENSTIITTEN